MNRMEKETSSTVRLYVHKGNKD